MFVGINLYFAWLVSLLQAILTIKHTMLFIMCVCVCAMVGGSSQIWDLASGKLKLSLTGHISTVRGVAVSSRSPYLFSCGEDKQVKCWDLEYNKVQ